MGLLDKLFNRQPQPGKPLEINDENFEQLVLASDTPAVVSFFRASCSHCQVMSGLLNELGPLYADRVKVYKMNASNNPETARMYQIRSVPTTVFFKNHRPRDMQVGLIALNNLRDKFNQLI